MTPTRRAPFWGKLWGKRGGKRAVWQRSLAPRHSASEQVSAVAKTLEVARRSAAVFAHPQAPRVSMWLVVAGAAGLAVFLTTRDTPPVAPPDVETSAVSAAPAPVPPVVRGEQPSVNPPAAQRTRVTQPSTPALGAEARSAKPALGAEAQSAKAAAPPVQQPRATQPIAPAASRSVPTVASGAAAQSAKPALAAETQGATPALTAQTQAPRAAVAASTPAPAASLGAGAQSAKAAPGFRGSLAVRSSPEGARVFVNGAPVGVTPLLLEDLAAGSRAVRVELEGYERWSVATRVVANESTAVVAELRPLPAR